MNKEKMNQIIDEAYRKYADSHNYFVNGWLHVIPMAHNKETFITEIKTNPSFSEKWGLRIEERELSLEERWKFYYKKDLDINRKHGEWDSFSELSQKNLDQHNIPTKLITITYNDIKTEIYE